jgi:sigma-B regulation protein RsbU (phosphoserine phosphatase)
MALSQRTTRNRFITAFLALVDPAVGRIQYTNAGHNPILVLRRDGSHETLESQGFPLALFPGGEYGQGSVELGPGDLLYLYTDGISEAADPEGNEFDLEAVLATLRALGPLPLPDLQKGLLEAVARHTAGAPLSDDQTIVLLRRKA